MTGPITAPIPIPALAPVDKLEDEDAVGPGECVPPVVGCVNAVGVGEGSVALDVGFFDPEVEVPVTTLLSLSAAKL